MGEVRTKFFLKKGQISLFVIIGIVFTLAFITFFIMRAETEKLPNNEASEISDYEEIALVQQFITSCLSELSEDALVLAGNQGGYTDLRSVGASTSYYDTTNADGFTFSENSQIQIPYWHYLASANECSGDCFFFSQRPRLEGTSARTVEQQIKTFINRNFAECLQNFAPFTEQGYNLTQNMVLDEYVLDSIDSLLYPFDMRVLFREDDVNIVLEYPLTITKGEITSSVSKYSTTHDIPFKRMFELASLLTALQFEYRYLESQTIELISLNSGIDRDKLPPLGGATNEFASSIFWVVTDVQKKVEEMLSVYTNALRVSGTRNYYEITFPNSPVKAALDQAFANMVIPLDEDGKFADLEVNYDYLNWPWYFNINSNGGIIEPESLSLDFFPFFGIQRYKHYYDISNPVRVAVFNTEARKGEGYTFAFGLENNVRNNEPMRENYADFTAPSVVAEITDEQQNTLVCNFDQRNTDNVTISVLDKNTGDVIPKAGISFRCGDETCTLGVSDANGEYTGALPICGGGFLQAHKDQIVAIPTRISTSLDFDADQTIEVERIVEKEISAEKLLIVKEFERQFSRWIPRNSYSSPDVTEEVIISVTRIEEDPGADPYTTVGFVDGSAGYDEVFTMRLVPGYYEVTINAILDERFYIPESNREKNDEEYTIDAIDMDKFPAGELKLNGQSRLWHLTAEELYGETEIVFRYPGSDLPNVAENYRVVEDLQKPRDVIDRLVENNISLFIPNIINVD